MSHPKLLGALCAVVIIGVAVDAWATPSAGVLYNNFLSNGVTPTEIDTHAHVTLPATSTGTPAGNWGATVEAEPTSNFAVQDAIFAQGGYTGWHTHPGVLQLTLVEGTIEWYDAQCKVHVYHAGDSWTEGTTLHYVRVQGSANARFIIAYIVPKGMPKRIDEAAPACAAPLGLY